MHVPACIPHISLFVPDCMMKHASHVGHMSDFADYRLMVYASEQTVLGHLGNLYAGQCFAKVFEGFEC